MEACITIHYCWTVREWRRAKRHDIRGPARSGRPRILTAINLLLLLAGASGLVSDRWRAFGLGAVGIALAWGVAGPWRRWRALGREFAVQRGQNSAWVWWVYPDRLVGKNEVDHFEFKWETLSEVVQTPEGYLLYPVEPTFYWLPRAGFDERASYGRLAEWARDRVPKLTVNR